MRVLLATAAPEMRDVLRGALAGAGHAVTAADSAAATLAALERELPELVVVDDRLCGDVAGDAYALDVCRAVRARAGSEAFVLVVTSDEEPGRLEAVLGAGADDFVLTTATADGLPARLGARAVIAERRIALNAARRRAESALARTQRLAGIGDAASALQHEINNPLAALLAHAALIEQELYEPGEERELLGVIVEQAHRIAAVVKRIGALRYPADNEEFVPDDTAPGA